LPDGGLLAGTDDRQPARNSSPPAAASSPFQASLPIDNPEFQKVETERFYTFPNGF
jgi:hypothetical protein